MKVVYSDDAKEEIRQYKEALKKPPYNKKPIVAYKMQLAFRKRLRDLGMFWNYRVCDSTVLGQHFDENTKKTLITNLKQFSYRGFSISFLVDEENKIIQIHKIYNGSGVTEWYENNMPMVSELNEFHSWMKRLDEVKGARPTYWCE